MPQPLPHPKLVTVLFTALFIVIGLCPLSFFSLTGDDLPSADAYNNVEAGFRFNDPAMEPSREPLYPFLLSQYFTHTYDDNVRTKGFKCFKTENLCPEVIRDSKKINWAFHALSTIAAGFFIILLTGRKQYALAAMALLAFNWTMITGVNNWLTEPQALFFLLVHSVCLYGIFRLKPGWLYALGAGITAVLLVLTKAIFLYLLYLYFVAAAALFVYAFARKDTVLKKSATPFLLMAVIAVLLTTALMPGRHETPQDFDRGAAVLAIRAEYDTMLWSDVPAAFLYFTPGGEEVVKKIYGADTVARFDRKDDDSYYRRVKNGGGRAFDLAKKEKIPLQSAALKVMGQNAAKHIVLTPVFAWQGLFIPKKIYFNNIHSKLVKIPSAIVNNALLPLCLFAAICFIRRKQYDILLLALPAAYSFAMHSALTHYWPRYSLPLLGIGLVFACVAWHEHRKRKLE